MNIASYASTESLARRGTPGPAARALADPAGCASSTPSASGTPRPATCSDELGMTSNLLAHHLRVLERRRPGRAGTAPRPTGGAPTCSSTRTPSPACCPPTAGRPSRASCSCAPRTRRGPSSPPRCGPSSAVPAASAGTHPADAVAAGAVAVARRHGLPLARATPAPPGRRPAPTATSWSPSATTPTKSSTGPADPQSRPPAALVGARPGPRRHRRGVRRRLRRPGPARHPARAAPRRRLTPPTTPHRRTPATDDPHPPTAATSTWPDG